MAVAVEVREGEHRGVRAAGAGETGHGQALDGAGQPVRGAAQERGAGAADGEVRMAVVLYVGGREGGDAAGARTEPAGAAA